MTTLQVDTAYWETGLWMLVVGIGSGMFNSPNTAAMMGTVPAKRRGIAAGARMMLQNTGAVLSIAFVLAIVTAAVPKPVLFKIFSGLASGLGQAKLDPFIANMHTALWVLAATSLVGAGGLAAAPAPPARRGGRARPHRRGGVVGMSDAELRLRIGEVAELTGTTPRTIRYYEEKGLLTEAPERESGRAPHLYGPGRRPAARAPAPARAARRLARRAQGAVRGRGDRVRPCGASSAPATTRCASARSSPSRSATWTASSSSSATAATRSPSSRPSSWPGGGACAPASATSTEPRRRHDRRPRRRPRGPVRRGARRGRRVLRGRPRRGVRPARPQRRRQDDHPARAHHAAAPDRGPRRGGRLRRAARVAGRAREHRLRPAGAERPTPP